MGWITVPKPGTKYGPCIKRCKHKDCAASREQASLPCYLCQQPIGYDTKFYCDTAYDDAGKMTGRTYSHFVCNLREADRRWREQMSKYIA